MLRHVFTHSSSVLWLLGLICLPTMVGCQTYAGQGSLFGGLGGAGLGALIGSATGHAGAGAAIGGVAVR